MKVSKQPTNQPTPCSTILLQKFIFSQLVTTRPHQTCSHSSSTQNNSSHSVSSFVLLSVRSEHDRNLTPSFLERQLNKHWLSIYSFTLRQVNQRKAEYKYRRQTHYKELHKFQSTKPLTIVVQLHKCDHVNKQTNIIKQQ
jgi:hypothetical protein